MSIDEREDPDEEEEAVCASLPFVASHEVMDTYGENYSITLDEKQFPVVAPRNGGE